MEDQRQSDFWLGYLAGRGGSIVTIDHSHIIFPLLLEMHSWFYEQFEAFLYEVLTETRVSLIKRSTTDFLSALK